MLRVFTRTGYHMQHEMIEPPDITGFETTMRDFLQFAQSHTLGITIGQIEAMVGEFTLNYRHLDAWVRRAKRCRDFQPMEPVIKGTEVGVVISVTSARVNCRLFRAPKYGRAGEPQSAIRSCSPEHIKKVTSPQLWSQWCSGLLAAGFGSVEEWTSRHFSVEDIEDIASGATG